MQVVDFVFVHVGQYRTRDILPAQHNSSMRMITRVSDDDGPMTTAYGTAICPLCARPTFFRFSVRERHLEAISANSGSSNSLRSGGGLIEVYEALPTPPEPEIDPNWPEEIHDYFRDAQAFLAEGRSPAIIITTCRSVLELAVRRLGGEGRDLRARIDDLRTKGLITEGLREWAHATRTAGNEAVHELGGTAIEAKELVEFVRQFLDVAFTLPATIVARKREAESA